ncbi:ABC transporter ATP-binding protein [Peribacillus muralis]|uniref:ABC transporter ATP-binding protein n=1 Tax=Peribacillus muralis TaxID=264697 RepID=UPI001F4E1D57|nr:dipeptide/oligopeptide/nickel ABC transporter ATP-binding protein [Peribacillus muralis]MCK1992018.1 dipeptide/oligopeptide/nickel ABC transporter ATP-binding protein [Peribacillus muralis]MCK2012574.1 dipeptide/oligopeptide/nickel ABC transporter ATP-binding protein [Peribacillus muralis]
MSLLDVRNVHKSYETGVEILRNVNFSIERKECLGLVGESGCGKSTLARIILQIESFDQGCILFEGTALQNKSERSLNPYRKNIQAVLQNPAAALNPKLKIKNSLVDPYQQFGSEITLKHFTYTSEANFIGQLLETVELPKSFAERYPHELSGGQKQRVTIARAISIEPALIILDEPASSLDVLSQAAVLKLLGGLRKTLDISYLFISHDLSAVQQMSQRILVMKEGEIVDSFEKELLFTEDRHPYTKELISLFE